MQGGAEAALKRVQDSLHAADDRHIEKQPTRLRKALGIVWVTGTTLLICCIAYTSQLFIIIPTYESAVDERIWRELLLFNILVLGVFWTYRKVVTTDPGRVPPNWKPPFVADDDSNPMASTSQTIEVKKLSGRPRYCRSCRHYKPPRAHHCRQCRRCVLKLDHHCPWTNNCIGHGNYASFIRFLSFVDVACGYHLYLISRAAFGDTFYTRPDPSETYIIFLVINYALSIPVVVAVGFFTIYHIWCLVTNTTTIESLEKDRAATLVRRGRIHEVKYPYDLGIRANVKSVLGDKPIFWCWPGTPAVGDGLTYPMDAALHPFDQYNWPPVDLFPTEDSEDEDGPLPPQCADTAYTYGSGRLNPALYYSSENSLESDSSAEDDDVPLNRLRKRVRQGSEGYEVKPVRFKWQDD